MGIMEIVEGIMPSKRGRGVDELVEVYRDIGYIMGCVDGFDKKRKKVFRKTFLGYESKCGKTYVLRPASMLEVYNRVYEHAKNYGGG